MSPELQQQVRQLQAWDGFKWEQWMVVLEPPHGPDNDWPIRVVIDGWPWLGDGKAEDPVLNVECPANWGFLLSMLRSLQGGPGIEIEVNEYYGDYRGFKKGDKPWLVSADREAGYSEDFNLGVALLTCLLVAIGEQGDG